jgi:hypothetical protein
MLQDLTGTATDQFALSPGNPSSNAMEMGQITPEVGCQ